MWRMTLCKNIVCSAVTAFISAQLSSAGQLFSALSFTDSYDWEGHWIDFTLGGQEERSKQTKLPVLSFLRW